MMNKDTIKIAVPRKGDYISLVRLTTSSIAHSLKFNVEDIEDIKVCVGEACVNVINNRDKSEDSIEIEYTLYENELKIRVGDVISNISQDNRELELGLLIIRSLMDEVKFEKDSLEMIKYI